jgi:NADH-quinone oxidoreductase subunit A
METASQLSEFGKIFLFMIMGTVLVSLTLFISRVVAPRKPTPEKLLSYECGEDPKGNSWVQFNPRFYVVALIFLLFDVELVFIFPWATIFSQELLIQADPRWGWLTMTEMFIFIGILILGLVYVWKKGDLEWVRPNIKVPDADTCIPMFLYEKINSEKYVTRPFSTEIRNLASEQAPLPTAVATPPAFKPIFRKPKP